MANDIKIRLVSELHPQGFSQAVAGMKQVETAYTETTGKILANAKGNVPKMVKAYKSILESGMNDAPKYAGQYFQNWANALIYNFSGGDAAKLKATLQKAIAEITNISGDDKLAFVDMTELNKNLAEVSSMYDEASTGIESASRRKQAMYEKEVTVLRKLGLQQEEYNLTMKNAKEQMLALSPSMRNYKSEMERLSAEYTKAKANLEQLTAEQARASKGGFGQYVGTVVKGLLVHQAVAKAVQAVKQTIKEASQAAAEAEQRYNKLDTVFEGFTKTARDLTSTLASAIGVANSTAASALTTVGDLLQAQGMGVAQSLEVASDWVKRFQDIINFKDINESLDTFSSNIMAGFLGNTRNLRSIGVVIKDSAVKAELAARNMDKLTGSELELAKMNIRAEMTFKQLENAMGATEREWDTNLAVNRRLNEAWKEYRENLGETINSVLKPMKSWWTGILEQINKANKAQKEFEAGNKEINVYNVAGNEKDRLEFYNRVDPYIANINAFGTEKLKSLSPEALEYIIEPINEELIKFGVSVSQLNILYENKLNPTLISYLKTLEDAREKEIQYGKDVEARRAKLASANDEFDKFQETLLGITGVKFDASDMSGMLNNTFNDNAMNAVLNQMATTSMQNIDAAIKSIAEAELSIWGDVITGELEGLDIPKLFEKKMESVAELFSAVWNESLKDGVIDDEERGKLEKLKALYADLGKQLDAYNAELERQKNVQSKIESMRGNAKSYQTQYEQLGMTDTQKAVDDLAREYADFRETTSLTALEIIKANNAYMRQVYWLEKLQKAQAEIERKEKARTAILEAQNGVMDIQKQIAQLRMSDEEKALDDLKREYLEQIKTLNLTGTEQKKLYFEYSNQAKALIRLQELTKQYNEQLEQEEKRKQTLSEYREQRTDYRTQLAQLGMSDRQITASGLATAGAKALKSGDIGLATTIFSTLVSFEKLQDALKEIDRKAYAEEIINQFDGMTYAMEIATLGMDENQKALYELDEKYRIASQDAKLTADEIDEMTTRYEAQRKSLEQLQKTQEFYTKLAERNALLSSYQTGGSYDYTTQLANFGLSNTQITRNKMIADRDAALLNGDANLWVAIQKQIVAFDALQKKTKELADAEAKAKAQEDAMKNIRNKVTPYSNYIDAYQKGQTAFGLNPLGGVMGLLAEIVSQTETFGKVANIVADYIIPTVDRLLSPMLPMIESIGVTLAGLVDSLLIPVIIPTLASAIIALDIISRVIMTISAVVRTIYYAITLQWGKIGDAWTEWYDEQGRQSGATKTALDALVGITKGIESNTSKDNSALLEAYQNLLNNQMITASEFDALVSNLNGVKYDRTRTYNGTSWNNSTGGTTIVYSGDMKFTIQGTNLNADQIAEAVIRKQKQWAVTGQYH